ncbi:hypothetical protein Tco_1200653 [Tanacetum coccineum]
MLNVGPTTGSLDQQALETEVTQLKDALTSLRIQNDGYKIRETHNGEATVCGSFYEICACQNHQPFKCAGSVLSPLKMPGKYQEYVARTIEPSCRLRNYPWLGPRTNVTLSMEPVLKPLELTPCVSSSSSSTVTMVSRFFDYRLGDRKAGSNGISAIFE